MLEVARRVAAVAPVVSYFLASAAFAQNAPAQSQGETGARNEKVCETIILTGSRLGKKRFCGTRAEWAERRMRDREEIEKAQRMPCVVNGTTCK